jgi:hypothetical protein
MPATVSFRRSQFIFIKSPVFCGFIVYLRSGLAVRLSVGRATSLEFLFNSAFLKVPRKQSTAPYPCNQSVKRAHNLPAKDFVRKTATAVVVLALRPSLSFSRLQKKMGTRTRTRTRTRNVVLFRNQAQGGEERRKKDVYPVGREVGESNCKKKKSARQLTDISYSPSKLERGLEEKRRDFGM